ncbi:hypothetical protein C7459_10644 [Tumebacillus permanentifrigoris]|jgi:hypothetical protein|uniref:Uncharacterized protein n=1 Tax=Tumebacillus permanentifrigoris TaxID=378543 RepID=A0A316D9B8_9BACL|nr:hypothetical protein C7459_10644 [Tumebacillus permanentifrigoris]
MSTIQVTERARQELLQFREDEHGRVCVRFYLEMEGG